MPGIRGTVRPNRVTRLCQHLTLRAQPSKRRSTTSNRRFRSRPRMPVNNAGRFTAWVNSMFHRTGVTLKTKTLFAYLLHCGQRGATAEKLADLLWPEANSTDQGLNRLYHTVHCLRMALSPELDRV